MGLLTNLGVGPAMGITAENVADEYDVTREQMDALIPSAPSRELWRLWTLANSRMRSFRSRSKAEKAKPSSIPTNIRAATPVWKKAGES